MAARSGIRSLSASALNEKRPSANEAPYGRSHYASTRKLPPPRARNRYSNNQEHKLPNRASSSSDYDTSNNQPLPLPHTRDHDSHAHAAERGLRGDQEYNSDTVLAGIGENNDCFNLHKNTVCDDYYIDLDDEKGGNNSEYDSAHDQRHSRSQNGYSDDDSDYDSEYSTCSFSDYSTQSAAPALPQFSNRNGAFRVVGDDSQKARRGSTSSAPLPSRNSSKGRSSSSSSGNGAQSRIISSSLTSRAVAAPRRAQTRDSVGYDRMLSSSSSSSSSSAAKEFTPALRALLAVNFLCDPSVYGCLRSLNVQTVDQLAAYSAHDFAGPRGKMNMIQARKLEAMCHSYQSRNTRNANSQQPMNNSMATPVATTTSSGKTARSSPDSVLDFMGTPPLPEENDVETDISSDVPVYGHHPHQQHNSAAAVDSWAPVQPLTGRRRLGAAHNRGSGGASGSGPSLNLLSSSIGPGLVPLAKEEEPLPTRAASQFSAPLQAHEAQPSTSSVGPFARPRACRRSGTSLDQVTGFNIGDSNYSTTTRSSNYSRSRLSNVNGNSSDTEKSNNVQGTRPNRRPTAWELRTGGPPSPSRFGIPPAALPQPPPSPPLFPLLPQEPQAAHDSSFGQSGSDFEAIMREQLQVTAAPTRSHLNNNSSNSSNGRRNRNSKAKPLPKGIDALAARLRQAAESSGDSSGSDANISNSSSSTSDENDDDEDEFGSFSLDLDRRRARESRRRMPTRRHKPSRRRAPQRTSRATESLTSQLLDSESNNDDDLVLESERSLLSIETLSPVRNRQNRSNQRRQNRRQRPTVATTSDSSLDSPAEGTSASFNAAAARRNGSVGSIDVAGRDDPQPTGVSAGVAPNKSTSSTSSSYFSWPRLPRSSLFSTSTSQEAITAPPTIVSSMPAQPLRTGNKNLPTSVNATRNEPAKSSKSYSSRLFGFSSSFSNESPHLSSLSSAPPAAPSSPNSTNSNAPKETPSTPVPRGLKPRKSVANGCHQQASSPSITSSSSGATSPLLRARRKENTTSDRSNNNSNNNGELSATVCKVAEVDDIAHVKEDDIILGFLDRLKKLNDSYDLLPAPFSAEEVAATKMFSNTGASPPTTLSTGANSVPATTLGTSGVVETTEDPFVSSPRLLYPTSTDAGFSSHKPVNHGLANAPSSTESTVPNELFSEALDGQSASTTTLASSDTPLAPCNEALEVRSAATSAELALSSTDGASEWTRHLDPSGSGNYYWYNSLTGESKWEEAATNVEGQHADAVVNNTGNGGGDGGGTEEFPPTPEWKSTRGEHCMKNENSGVAETNLNDEKVDDEDTMRQLASGARRHSWDGGSPLRPTIRTRRSSNSFNENNSGNTTLHNMNNGSNSSSSVACGNLSSAAATASGPEESSRGFETHNDGGGRRKDSRKALRSANEEWRARMAAKKKSGGGGGGRREAPTGDSFPLQESET